MAAPYTPDENLYDLYQPYLIYSPDGSHFLDLYSYFIILEKNQRGERVSQGTNVDTEASVVDLNQNTKKRLLFFGPLVTLEDGFWMDNRLLVIAGLVEDTENSASADPIRMSPAFWVIDLTTLQFAYYKSPQHLPVTNFLEGYLSAHKFKGVVQAP